MATLAASAILTAIREVLEDGAGTVRTIAAGTYLPGSIAASTDGARSVEALKKPRVTVRITADEPHPARPAITGSFDLRALTLEVRITRPAGVIESFGDDDYTALQALAATDGSVIRQALTWPGNLTQTAAAAPTGLVSGCLRDGGSSFGLVEFDGDDGLLVTLHTLTGIAQIALATS